MRTGLRAGWIRRRWWVLVLAVVAATAIGALVASVRPSSYQASLVFVVKSTSEEISPDGAQSLASTYAALLPEDDLIARAIGKAVNRPTREVKKRLTAINPIDTALVRATYEGSTKAEALAGMAALQDAITSARPASPAVRSRSILPVQAATVTTPSSALISIVLAALLGLCAGAVLVIALERSDVRVDDPATLMESVPDIPVLGTVPPLGRHTATPVQSRPFSPAAEGFQGIRLALERIGFGTDFHVLVVMSADKQEGKSTLAANLGMALARQARTVLLISGDLRTPQLEKLLGVTPSTGWAELLGDEGDEAVNPVLRLVSVAPDLWLLPAGFPSANPAELMERQRVREVLKRMHQEESLVIIDTPPALHSAEAAALTGMGDGIVLVVRSGHSRLRAVREIIAGLRRNKLRLLGMVLVDHRDGNGHTYVWGADDPQAMNDSRILPLESRARRSYPSGGGTRELR